MAPKGQEFWELLTGEPDFYIRISDAIAKPAALHKSAFDDALQKKHSELLRQFMLDYVDVDGTVRWRDVVEFNSSRLKPKQPRKATSQGI